VIEETNKALPLQKNYIVRIKKKKRKKKILKFLVNF